LETRMAFTESALSLDHRHEPFAPAAKERTGGAQ
jgi:hypothetical protein